MHGFPPSLATSSPVLSPTHASNLVPPFPDMHASTHTFHPRTAFAFPPNPPLSSSSVPSALFSGSCLRAEVRKDGRTGKEE